MLSLLQARPSTHQLAAKYAAMLPLAGMDPCKENKDAADRRLREFVVLRRHAAQQYITSMASSSSKAPSGGSTLQELPEMVVPYVTYILAHHPDFPEVTYDPYLSLDLDGDV